MPGESKARSGNRFMDSSPSLDWRLKAACRDKDPEMWMAGKASKVPVLRDAKKICDICPVHLECGRMATKADLQYSMRAGKWPLLQPKRPRGRPRKEVAQEPSRPTMLDKGECVNGHKILYPEDLTGGGMCKSCAAAAQRVRRNVKRGACRNGHVTRKKEDFTVDGWCCECRRLGYFTHVP